MIEAHTYKTFSIYGGMKKEPPTKPFNRALFYFLTERKVTFAEILAQTGLSQGYISHLKNGEYEGKESTRRKIAEVCGYDGSGPGKNYDDFIKLGQSMVLIDRAQRTDHKPVHKNTTLSWQEEKNGKQESSPENETESKIRAIHQEHKNLIDAFLDKTTAYDINKKLLEIERYDPEVFQHVKDYVDLIYSKIDIKKNAGNDSE